jgi:uncharacterized membrane protein YeaQ/YmgE (transglycosylase-associated protein family)
MGCLLVLVLLVIVFGVGTFITVGLIGLFLTLIMAGLVGWAADLVVPGHIPGGWFGAVLTGLIGGFVGTWLFQVLHVAVPGIELFGINLIPAFVGAVVIAVVAQLVSNRRRAME